MIIKLIDRFKIGGKGNRLFKYFVYIRIEGCHNPSLRTEGSILQCEISYKKFFLSLIRNLLATPSTTGTPGRATYSTTKKQRKGKKRILLGSRARGRYWRAESERLKMVNVNAIR
jgi:hypothetical protein